MDEERLMDHFARILVAIAFALDTLVLNPIALIHAKLLKIERLFAYYKWLFSDKGDAVYEHLVEGAKMFWNGEIEEEDFRNGLKLAECEFIFTE